MTVSTEFVRFLGVRNILGESILWNQARQSIFWTDIESCLLYEYLLDTDTLTRYLVPERLCSFGFTSDSQQLVAAFASGLAIFDLVTEEVDWLLKLIPGGTVRFNDGRVDARGRFWAGTMVESGESPDAALYCLDRDGCVTQHLDGIRISNGICWSPDSERMYFADSAAQEIQAFPFDAGTARLGRGRRFSTTNANACPDGAVTDADGYLWCAHWGGSCVVRYAPDGSIDYKLELPVTQPTCVAFGGPGLDQLFVTTAAYGMNASQLAAEPMAGRVLVYQTNTQGVVSSDYVLDTPEVAAA